MPEVVEQRFFSKFDAKGGNNKFWNIKLHDDNSVETHWGPQGQSGTTTNYDPDHSKSGKKGFEGLIKVKLSPRKGYTENKVVEAKTSEETSVKTSNKSELKQKAVDDIAKGQPALAKIIGYFAEVNAHNLHQASGGKITYNATTGLFSTTQGVVTLEQIQEARDLLTEIAVFSDQGEFDSDRFFNSVNPYLSIIPQKGLVRKLVFSDMFSPDQGLQRQLDILDGLESSYSTAMAQPQTKQTKKKDTAPQMFRVLLERIGDKKEFDKIKNFYNKTKGGHRDVAHYDVYTVYKLSIDTMSEAFKNKGSKVGNIKRLWHGTKASNMLSILKGGMIIPKGYGGTIQVTGRMFGDGLYFSDQSTKAIRYATGAWGGGGSSDRKFMFLVDVAMGNEYFPSGWSGNLTLPRGYHSCFAKAGRSGVMNNEMIVYNTAQANPVYIVEFTPYGRK